MTAEHESRTKVRAVRLLTETDDCTRARAIAALDRTPIGRGTPFGQFARDWVHGIPNARTAELYGKLLARWFAWCAERGLDPASARPRDARIYHASMTRLAPRTRAMALLAARRFYEEAMDEDIVDADPFRRVIERKPRYRTRTPALTEAEFEHVLERIRSSFDQPHLELGAFRDYTLVYLMGRIGLRRREAWQAKWGEISQLAGRYATVHVVGKWESAADVILPDDVMEVLAAWRARLAAAIGRPIRPTDPLFVCAPYGVVEVYGDGSLVGLSLCSVGTQIRKRFLDAGIKGQRYSSHVLRATAATIAYEHGADLEAIRAQLRHSTLDQTRAYIRRWQEGQRSGALVWKPSLASRPDAPPDQEAA